ncbi:hypothetical protein CVT24_004321 [Panaeolus cyanescens]|uniref:Rad21/Rec8-like protein N-terminal domain-containing protein n=1 Tax=Panaeolus cyanescens TaxID=181874 RepID=A0A409VCJ5_9AGAR|nr:hypothetical protein CVT24_004321 [Panaeolus cyanescens]
MFFTPELLSKRDSGFGLLWLAATLGSKSAFKKLPKRSVLTADIAQLCDLISEPAEPLALLKQEIFMADVSNCVASLKKVVQEARSVGLHDGQIITSNPVARYAAVTIAPDPRSAYSLDFDALVMNWDEYLNVDNGTDEDPNGTDDEFDPKAIRKKKKAGKASRLSAVETVRKEAHTLEEHHEHLLSASFDLPHVITSGNYLDPSSSHADGGFDFFFSLSDGFDLSEGPGIADDLARELGWNLSPAKTVRSKTASEVRNERPESLAPLDNALLDYVPHFTEAPGEDFNFGENTSGGNVDQAPLVLQNMVTPIRQSQHSESFGSENYINAPETPNGPLPVVATQETPQIEHVSHEPRKLKRTRVLLDARIELTDDELKLARAQYVEAQTTLRRETFTKQREKASGMIIEDLIWRAPKQITNPELISFWEQNLRVQVELRTGHVQIHSQADDNIPAAKRRRITPPSRNEAADQVSLHQEPGPGMNDGWDEQHLAGPDLAFDDAWEQRQSSEEPGRGRRGSRAPSIDDLEAFGMDTARQDRGNAESSQKSSLFPWDNALPSSSSGNNPYTQPDGDVIAPDMVDVRIRSRSISRRGSPLLSSHGHQNSFSGAGMSPMTGNMAEDFMFQGPHLEETQQDTQKSDANLITLEKNSFNFLEYAKMQSQTLPQPNGRLTFERVTPRLTSTRHVAAAAFYHCLGKIEILLEEMWTID